MPVEVGGKVNRQINLNKKKEENMKDDNTLSEELPMESCDGKSECDIYFTRRM